MTSTETSAPAPSRRDWIGLAALSIGLGLIVLDGTIVGIALPAIIADLHLDLTDAQWVNSLYAVLLAALLPVPETRGEKRRPGVDVDGALLSAIAFGALVFAVIEGPDLGWWTPKEELTVFGWGWSTDAPISIVPLALALAVVVLALGLFVASERHREKVRRSAWT